METTQKIIEMKRTPQDGGVFEVVWMIEGTKSEEHTRRIEVCEFEVNSKSKKFVPFEELTEEIVLNWVQTQLTEQKISELITEMESEIDEKIYAQQNPEFLQGTPWGN
jgi:hypothetical protein